ncbi:MAG: hypothetical protein JRG89_04165 [Deltaproteobacteria bacterium]|nr:hypothetical protein [Deltaproteobacteria bacterium]
MMRLEWLLFAAVSAVLVGCGEDERAFEIELVGITGSESRIELVLARGYLPGSLSVRLDDRALDFDAPGPLAMFRRTRLSFPVTGGRHVAKFRARFLSGAGILERSRGVTVIIPTLDGPGTASLVSSWPMQGTRNLARSEWVQLEFSAPPSAEMVDAFGLRCANRSVEFEVHRDRQSFILLNPKGQLPAGARCRFTWSELGMKRQFVFFTAVAGSPVWVEYDREIAGLSSPFPDDFFARREEASVTGLRIELPKLEDPTSLDRFAELLASEVDGLDGWSPVGHIFLALSDAVDPASIPQSPEESVHPASALQMLDTDPRSTTFGKRIPFVAETRDDLEADGKLRHSLLLFPLLPTRLGGQYAVVVTRAVRADPGRPFEPSAFMSQVLRRRSATDTQAVVRARARVFSALWVAEHVASPPIPRDDIALVFRFSTGTLEGLSEDLLHVRRQLQEHPAPEFSIDSVRSDTGAIAAIVTGTWHAPRWRDGANFMRDDRGRPRIGGSKPVEFTLALPRERAPRGAPLVIYQHGNPGDAGSEVPVEARRGLAGMGFAVLGFTDVFNRELSAGDPADSSILNQLASSLVALNQNARLPDYWLQTHAEQLAFLRLAEALRELDVLPLAAPDGYSDLDLAAPLAYLGMSEGANHAPAFLAYAPEIRSAALVVGGAPIAESLTHQIDASGLGDAAQFLMQGNGRDIWLGLSLLQTAIDRQDPIHHARFLYREPVPIDGDLRKPSVLLIAGVEDTRIPNRFTDALAWLLGPIPMIDPAPRVVPFLPLSRAPIRSNIDDRTTAAYSQIVPAGVIGVRASIGCNLRRTSALVASEGHFCAQVSFASIQQRLLFFQSALEANAPTISNPLVPVYAGQEDGFPAQIGP